MRPVHIFFVTILFSGAAFALPTATKVSGKVTLNGSPANLTPAQAKAAVKALM